MPLTDATNGSGENEEGPMLLTQATGRGAAYLYLMRILESWSDTLASQGTEAWGRRKLEEHWAAAAHATRLLPPRSRRSTTT